MISSYISQTRSAGAERVPTVFPPVEAVLSCSGLGPRNDPLILGQGCE